MPQIAKVQLAVADLGRELAHIAVAFRNDLQPRRLWHISE
jgi:hypothetical protein